MDQVSYVPGPTPPALTAVPPNRTVSAGVDTSFSISAVGTPPLNYQWQFNGTNISGTTLPTLALLDVQAANAGIYSITVTNDYGVASSNVTLTVTSSLPVFTLQPADQARPIRSGARLQAAARGSEPLTFQWQFNGVDIPDATNPVLLLSNLQLSNAGSYQVIASNNVGTVASSSAFLSEA